MMKSKKNENLTSLDCGMSVAQWFHRDEIIRNDFYFLLSSAIVFTFHFVKCHCSETHGKE